MKSLFCIGIKGVGIAPLALIAKESGAKVAGSDVEGSFITDEIFKNSDIKVSYGFELDSIKQFLSLNPDALVVTTGAHGGLKNPQAIYASKLGYKVITQGQALALFMEGKIFNKTFDGIAVSGTHGKTSTSAMLASALTSLKEDPTYVVGTSKINPLGNPGKLGNGKFFVAEADEYVSDPQNDRTPKLLLLKPKYAIITSIDFDHPDIYKNQSESTNVFSKFASKIDKEGLLVLQGDFPGAQKVKKSAKCKVITYGNKESNDIQLKYSSPNKFELTSSTLYSTNLLGEHNAHNAASVVILLQSIGYNENDIKNAILTYKGSKRRSEVIGRTQSGAIVIDDYAHHPIEVKTTLRSLKIKYKKIICIFQPHTYSRTERFISEFSNSFDNADKLLLLPIYASAREKTHNFSNDNYFSKMKKKYPSSVKMKSLQDVIEYLSKENLDSNWAIVTMGAGDIYKISEQIIK